MEINNILSENLCFILPEYSKNEVLFRMIEGISEHLSLSAEKKDEMTRNILYREQLMSTGIGLGIGIPHIRFDGVAEPILAVGVHASGIDDYASIDDEEIRIVVMIIVGKDQHKDHIRLLSLIIGKLKNEKTKEALLNAASGKEIYAILTGAAQ